MKESYKASDLLIGNTSYLQLLGGMMGVRNITEGPFIFEKQPTEEGKKQRYKEIMDENIISDDIIIRKLSSDIERQSFGKTYISDSGIDINCFLTEEEIMTDKVTKERLKEIMEFLKVIADDKVMTSRIINESVRQKVKTK